MSLDKVRDYFTTRALDLGFKKHYDGFAFDNIGSTVLDRTFHVEAFQLQGQGQNQTDQVFRCPVTVRLFFKGYQKVDDAIKTATIQGQAFVESALSSENRLGRTDGVKNITFDLIQVEPFAQSNDNFVVCRMEFSASVILGIC